MVYKLKVKAGRKEGDQISCLACSYRAVADAAVGSEQGFAPHSAKMGIECRSKTMWENENMAIVL